MPKKLGSVSALFILLSGCVIGQQDAPISLLSDVSMMINPSLVGQKAYALRDRSLVSINYKSQFNNAFNNIGIKNIQGSFEHLFNQENMSVGLLIYSNTVNKTALNDFNLMLSYAYHIILDKDGIGKPSQSLSLGVQGGFRQWSFSRSNLTFGSQYDPAYLGGFNPDLNPDMPNMSKKNLFDLHFGSHYFGRFNENISLQAGFSVFHLIRPESHFFEQGDRVNMRWVLHADLNCRLGSSLLTPSTLFVSQGETSYLELNMAYSYLLSDNIGFSATLGYRTPRVITPSISCAFEGVEIKFSIETYIRRSFNNLFIIGAAYRF